ncbi:hypothetical protein [Wolinella succinogenes]|uniref:hypothetical protein n=1 Tax=Wolinella succinogenes TaxID=844 RepID=UPI002FCBF271
MRPIARDIPKHDFLYDAIKSAISSFRQRTGVNPIPQIGEALGIRGAIQPQLWRLFDLYSDRFLRADELVLICEVLGPDSQIILDSLCRELGFSCVAEMLAPSSLSFESQLLTLSALVGSLSSDYLQAISDDDFSLKELKNHQKILRSLRGQLTIYEAEINDALRSRLES